MERNFARQISNYSGNREIQFEIGENVWVRDYRNTNKTIWKKAIIVNCVGMRNYMVQCTEEKELIWKRHVDRIRKAGNFFEKEFALIEERNNPEEVNLSLPYGFNTNYEVKNPPRITENLGAQDEIVEDQEKIDSDKRSNVTTFVQQGEKVCDNVNQDDNQNVTDNSEIINVPRGEKELEVTVKLKNECKTKAAMLTPKKISYNINERPKRVIKKPDRLNL